MIFKIASSRIHPDSMIPWLYKSHIPEHSAQLGAEAVLEMASPLPAQSYTARGTQSNGFANSPQSVCLFSLAHPVAQRRSAAYGRWALGVLLGLKCKCFQGLLIGFIASL